MSEGNQVEKKKKKKLKIHFGAGNKCAQLFTEVSAMGMRGGSQDWCEVSRFSRPVLGFKVLLVSFPWITGRQAEGHLAGTWKMDMSM